MAFSDKSCRSSQAFNIESNDDILQELRLMDNQEIFLLLSIGNSTASHLKIQKMSFIISKFLEKDIGSTAYKQGPFSETLMEKLQDTRLSSFVHKYRGYYKLGDNGVRAYSILLEKLQTKVKNDIKSILDTLQKMGDKDLTAVVYQLYPEATVESEIKQEIQSIINCHKNNVESKVTDEKLTIEVDD